MIDVKLVKLAGFPPFLATVYPPHTPSDRELRDLSFGQNVRTKKSPPPDAHDGASGMYDVARYKEEHA